MRAIYFFFITIFIFGCAHSKDMVRINLKDDPETIRCIVLTHTPVGTHSDDVLNFINQNLVHINKEPRYNPVYYNRRQGISSVSNGKRQTIGTRSINIILGIYGRSPFTLFLISTGVYVEWGFDENDRLLDVVVVKENDGP